MKVYEYFRSSASYRVRIGLNLKGLPAELVPVHLLRNGGEQFSPEFLAINPQARVPTLVMDDGTTLIQSPAILEWLEEVYPTPPFLPRQPAARAHVRGLAALIACDIHPLNNTSVLGYLKGPLAQGDDATNLWARHWITTGFTALEQMVQGAFCCGDAVTLADIYLVPQMANARRVHTDLSPFPKLVAIEQRCLAMDAFARARPEVQPSAA